ncbi:extracellular solute-binding protein [Paenibacillus sp. alder61]|uniref:extracellular solute-binding protein n=1 Tax=Paenibacillus sp. alder61 TaxID=2862948 RepID=UPI001CD64941|nr:extracellular solute-binding protein [Paenibacillus sp. alder61]MCA1295527.1 extracellular solute-binding protein [Paenibacillus sp. alder61]
MAIHLKRLFLLALLLASAGLLASCSDSAREEPLVVLEVDRWYPYNVEFPDPQEDFILQTIRKRLNIDLRFNFSTGRSQDWRTKLASRVASGDLPDMIYFFNMMDYRTARTQGYLIPLNEALKSGDLPEHLDYITSDMLRTISDDRGEYYGIPNRTGPAVEGLFIRRDWLNALSLDAPRTVQEFAEVAEAFAKEDPDGNGKDDTYGFTAGGCMSCQDFWELLSAFTGNTSPDEYLLDGQLKGGWTSSEYREYLLFMNGLMQSGALDPDLATNDSNTKREKIVQGQVGIFHYTGYPSELIQEMKAYNPQADIAYLPPLVGPAGTGSHWPTIHVPTTVGITEKAGKSPEKVRKIIELMNWYYSDEGRELILYGKKGVNHVRQEGRKRLLEGKQNEYLEVYSLIGERSLFLDDEEVMRAMFPDERQFEVVRSMIQNGGKRGSVYSMGYAMERAELIDDLKLFREQMAARFIYGNAPLDDKGWSDYADKHDHAYNGYTVREAMLSDLRKGGYLSTHKE